MGSKKTFNEQVEDVYKSGLQKLANRVGETLKKGAHNIQKAIDHAAKYPELTKFNERAPQRFAIMGFLEWLEEEYEFDVATAFLDSRSSSESFPSNLQNQHLVDLYHGIDAKKLRAERHAMKQEQPKKAKEK